MKGKLSRMLRSGLSVMLVFCMLISMAPAAFAGEADNTLHYVSLGASNTNGYGLFGYLPGAVSEDPLAASKAEMNVYGYLMAPEAAYPAQVASELKAWTGKEVELAQLAISSMRVEEVRYLLDDTMVPDEYMKWRFTGGQAWFEISEPGGVNVLKKAYRDALTKADYVTVDLGWNNFGVFAFNNIKTILADGKFWKEPEFSYYEDKITEEEYQIIRDKVLNKLSENMSGADADLKNKMELMADVLTAATLGACYNYDIVMEKIYELNPDVTVAVINIQNLADDLVVEFEGTELALGDLYGELIDLVNLYRASESPYANKIVYVDAGDVTTFLDELVAWDGEPTSLGGDTKDCFDMYDDNLYVRSIVEYMMVGQALSGLFDGFRTMAAGYGLEVFKNDSEYTYEFALTRTPEELLSLDLAALDFNNPGGPDADVELYGAAVAKHLKNLRGDEPNVAAYDYVFEGLSEGIQAQIAGVNKEELQATKPQLEEAIKQMEEASLPEEQIAPYKTKLAQVNQGLLAFEAVETIIPAAKAEFEAKFKAVHKTYHNTLNYAYDVVATIFREAAKNNNLEINTSSLNGFNDVSKALMGAVVNSFINGAMNKFYYELQKNGVQETGVTEDPALMVDDALALMKNNPAVAAISVLAVRYELGNSFFAHPNTKGHDEITDAVMNALKNGSNADSFTEMKTDMYIEVLKNRYPNLYQMITGAQNVGEMDDLAIIFTMLKMSDSSALAGTDLDALEAEIRAALRASAASKTPEEQEKAQAIVYDLMGRLYALAAIATGSDYQITEDSWYISLGDSTIGGYGLSDYEDGQLNGAGQYVKGSAHVLLAQHIYGDSWREHFNNLCRGALRADDLLLFLGGDVVMDQYYEQEIEPNLLEGSLAATQEEFISNVKKADLISVAVGGGNIFTFVGKQMNRVMGNDSREPLELDWARIGVDEDDATMKELNELLDLMVPIIDEMGLMDQYVPEDMGTLENPAKFSRALAESLLYGYASYNYYYPQVLAKIKEINPDAQLMIIGMFNPVDDWTMTTTINGQEVFVDIGGTVANLIDMANLQNLAFALQNNSTYVDIKDTETLLEAENPGVKFTFKDYYDGSMKSNGKSVHASKAGHKYIFNQMADTLSARRQANIILNELYNLLETYGPVAATQVWKIWEEYGYVDMVEKTVAKLNEKLEARYNYYANEALPAIDETVSALLDQKAVLEAELAALQAELDEVLAKQEISSVHTPNINIDVEIGNNEQTMVPEHECESDGTAEGELAAAIADLEHAIAVLEALIGDIDADIADMMALAQQIAAAVAELKKTMDDVAAAGADLAAAFAAIEAVLASENGADAYTAACATAKAALDVLELANATAIDATASIDEMMGIVAADAAALYERVLNDLPTIIEEDLMTDVVFQAGVGTGAYIGKIVYENRYEIEAKLAADIAALQAEADAKLAPLMEELSGLEVDLDALQADLEAKMAEAEGELEAEAMAALQVEIEKIEAAIATVQAQIDRVNSDMATIKADLECAIEHLKNAAELALTDAVKAAIAELLKDLDSALANLAKVLAEKGLAAVNDLVNEIVNLVKPLIVEATTEDYVISRNSYYVALGDGSAVSESYVDRVAGELDIKFANLSVDGQSLAEAPAYIAANAAEIAKADLITLGYGNNAFAKRAIDRAYAAMGGNTYESYDWAAMVGADGAAYVADALADIKAEMIASGMDTAFGKTTLADATVLALEAYAYAAMEYTMNLPAAIAAVRAVNPDAAVVIVGMYNPLEGATLAFNESAIAVGEYLDYLVAAADVYGIGYCMLFNNANYVSAPDAETNAANREHNLMAFLTEYMVDGDAVMNPNEEGHKYIKNKILNALNITVEAGTFYKKFMSGFDANTFRPQNNITRAQAAKMFGNILDESYKANYKFAGKFTDIPENFWAAKELEILSDMGVIKGFEDGTFRPNAPITRGQFAAMAVRFAGATIEGTENFSDIDKNTWCYDEVRTAVANGWIDGYADGTYRPQGKITRAAAAKIACGMLDRPMDEAFFDAQVEAGTMKALNDTVGTWAYYWILSATNSFVY